MKSLLFSVDHVYKADGSLTPLELNTATREDFPTGKLDADNFLTFTDGFYEHAALDTYMSESNFTKLVTIAPTGSVRFFEVFAGHYGYEFENYNTNPTDVTVPNVEDADDTLIIRIAYNTYAIVDDLYARDNYEFHNLVTSESFSSPVTFTTSSFDTINSYESSISSSVPNYVIKARFPEYEATAYPKVYNITSSAGLASLKSTLTNNDFLQKYEFSSGSGLTDDGRTYFLRSMNLAIGDGLENVLNICNYKKANAISTENSRLVYPSFADSSGLYSNIPAAQWYPTFHVRYDFKYHNEVSDLVLGQDDSLLNYGSLGVGSTVRGIKFSGQLNRYMTGSLSDLDPLTITGSDVIAIRDKEEGGIFVNVTASFAGVSKSWHDGYGNSYLTYRDGADVRYGAELAYLGAGEMQVGDKIYAFDSSSNEVISGSVTNYNFEFKDIAARSVTLTPVSQFLVKMESGDPNLFLIQHNSCESVGCFEDNGPSCDFQCDDCGKSAKFCINCGGSSTTTCK